MNKTYQPHDIEQHWYAYWEQQQYFKPSGQGDPYCIMIPPPNVTGHLHMGHGFQHTLMDALVRYHRMCGRNTLWQMGKDHAGIATQMVVERQLLKQGITRQELGREAFVHKIWDWIKEAGDTMNLQIRRMGASVDWDSDCFTMDAARSEAVMQVFIQLYEQGLIYKGQRLVNWDPALQTAISDLEVVTETEQGHLWYIRYPLTQSLDGGVLVVATTRPETLLGDVAVAVHPEDRRYQHLIGHTVDLPLTGRQIPIIADTAVDPEFGTGCVKITPAHDFNDHAMGQRHDLPLINILTPEGKINSNAPSKYQGLDRFVARERIIQDLKDQQLLAQIQPHTLSIPRGDRTQSVIEPYLTDQWFVKTQALAERAIRSTKNNALSFVPKHWVNTYYRWLEDIQDWCISRQLWWGHRIPVWYDDAQRSYVGMNAAEVRTKYGLSPNTALRQDPDVLDTWFSSALWPLSTLGWPERTPRFQTFYPSHVLVTGFDIIFFWVARMVMMGLAFTDTVPFEAVYITGLIRDAQGQKMSKSKGNVLDPIDLIDGIDVDALIQKRTQHLMQPEMAEQIAKQTRQDFPEGIKPHGTDALRFTYCALAATGRDIHFDLDRLSGYRNFCNKLWNASRYVLMQMDNKPIPVKPQSLGVIDRWVWSELHQLIEKTHAHFKGYRFDLLAADLQAFTWTAYCDWYIELSKTLLLSDPDGTRYTLIHTLEILLRLMHPIMPFITEAIWQRVAPFCGLSGTSIMVAPYPEFDASYGDAHAHEVVQWIQSLVTAIRTIRAQMRIDPGKRVPVLLDGGSDQDRAWFQEHQVLLMQLMKLSHTAWIEKGSVKPAAATAVIGTLSLLIPIKGLIDQKAESARLEKAITQREQQKAKAESRLSNPNYVEKAPPHIVAREQASVAQWTIEIAALKKQRAVVDACG